MKSLKAKHIKGILDGVPDAWEVGMFISEPYDFVHDQMIGPAFQQVVPTPKTHPIYEIRISPGRVTFYDYETAKEIKK